MRQANWLLQWRQDLNLGPDTESSLLANRLCRHLGEGCPRSDLIGCKWAMQQSWGLYSSVQCFFHVPDTRQTVSLVSRQKEEKAARYEPLTLKLLSHCAIWQPLPPTKRWSWVADGDIFFFQHFIKGLRSCHSGLVTSECKCRKSCWQLKLFLAHKLKLNFGTPKAAFQNYWYSCLRMGLILSHTPTI